jgi:DNA polymerase-3 subunit beta
VRLRSERDSLAEAFATVSRATAARATVGVLSGIHLRLTGGTLELTGSDNDLTIERVLEVDGSEDGEAVVAARLVTEVVRSLPQGAVEIVASQDGEVEVRGQRATFAVRSFPPSEFPRQSAVEGERLALDASALVEAVRQVARAASSEESRPQLAGVELSAQADGLRLVATDSYRLAMRTVPGLGLLGEGQKVLVPARALLELHRLATSLGDDPKIGVVIDRSWACFEVGSTLLKTRLLDFDFPDVTRLIPASYPAEIRVERLALIDALRRARLLSRDGANAVRLDPRDGVLGVSLAGELGAEDEELDATFVGEPGRVAFNPLFLLDGLDALTSDEVVIEVADPARPALLHAPESRELLYLLMPVRTS